MFIFNFFPFALFILYSHFVYIFFKNVRRYQRHYNNSIDQIQVVFVSISYFNKLI